MNQESIKAINNIELKKVDKSYLCKYSVIENKLNILYYNQEQILKAIKLLANGTENN